jgi:hypothetical protein
MTLWQGRFGTSNQSAELFAFTESLSFDRRLTTSRAAAPTCAGWSGRA